MSNITLGDLGIKGKIFCVSMQRTGTSSVGDFLEQYGLRRAGSPISNQRGWPVQWLNGNYSAILNDDIFKQTDVFEDDPWWFPEFYKYLYHSVPGSRFILLDRDSDAWFKSMIRHSNGFSIGLTELHSKLYRRENELYWLQENIKQFNGKGRQELVLYDKPQHYISIYERHNREVREYFSRVDAQSLFYGRLENKDKWYELAEWLRVPVTGSMVSNIHVHKSKGEFTQEHLLIKGNRVPPKTRQQGAKENRLKWPLSLLSIDKKP
jgi:hypothetical protein